MRLGRKRRLQLGARANHRLVKNALKAYRQYGLLSIAILVGVFFIGKGVFAQEPALNVVLRVQSDGSAPFDATTFDPNNPAVNGGTDANGSNGMVRLLDYVTYRAEVSVNDADQTNVVVRFTADDDQKWTELPEACQKTANNPSITPTSEITDLTEPDDKRVLICNIGAQSQGTKLVIKPVAQISGLGTNATLTDKTVCDGVPAASELDPSSGCVSAFSTIESAEHSTQVESNFVSVLTTAHFRINMSKISLPISWTGDPLSPVYGPKFRNQPGPTGLNVGNGQIVEWVITAQAQRGSEPIKPDANGKRDFVLTDTFVDDNPNNNVGLADGSSNADRSSNARLWSWNPDFSACHAIGTEIGSITCTQAGGSGAGANENGAPITVTLNDVDVTYPEVEGRVFQFKMRMWVPIDSNQAAPNDHDIMSNTGLCDGSTCTTNVTNRITGLDTPDPLLDGASPVITSPTNQQNYSGTGDPGGTTPGSGDNDFVVPVDSAAPGGAPFMVGGKTFLSNDPSGALHPGTKTTSREEIVPMGLNMWGNAALADGSWLTTNPDTYARVCDPIDTNNFEFAGTPANGEQHPYLYGTTEAINEPYNSAVMDSPNIEGAHYVWDGNPHINLRDTNDKSTVITGDHLTNTQLVLEYTDTAHSNDPVAMRDYNCDSGQNWVTDPASLPGGIESVTAVRMTLTNVDVDELKELHTISEDNPGVIYIASFHYLKVKSGATGYSVPNATIPGDYLANFSHYEQGFISGGAVQLRAPIGTTDTASADFSRTNYYADRLRLVAARTGILKELADPNQKVIKPGETTTFRITPYLVGQHAGTVDLTVTDTYPNTPAQMTFVSAEVDPTCSTSNGTYETFSDNGTNGSIIITGVTAGQPICPLLVTLKAPLGAPAGTYLNKAVITSSDATINQDSLNSSGQPPSAVASVAILAFDGYYIEKFKDRDVYEVDESIRQQLVYTNLGSEDYTEGNFIDVLPYNGDHGDFTLREDTLTPDDTKGSDYTNADGGANNEHVGLAAVPTGTNGETFYYTTANPSTIPIDPCHSANQPLGFTPSAGHYCYQAYVDNGNQFDDGEPAGTGTIDWSTTAPTDLSDVTAIRWDSTPHAAGSPARTVTLQLAAINNLEGDVYCNNFDGRIPEIALDIRSNDICERVVAGTISGTVFSDSNASGGNFSDNASDPTYDGIELQLQNADGSPYDTDPVTVGVQAYIVTTNADGEYQFVGLPSGSYRVVVLNPPTPDQAYDLDDNSPPIPAAFTTANDSGAFVLSGPSLNAELTDVDNQPEVDFSYTGTASLAGKVWFDKNRNGQQDSGETFFGDVPVRLLDEDGSPVNNPDMGEPWIIQTDNTGNFLFSDIIPGRYRVSFTPPTGYTCTVQHVGDAATDSDGNPSVAGCMTSVVTVLAGDAIINLDLGLAKERTQGDSPPNAPDAGMQNMLSSVVLAALAVSAVCVAFMKKHHRSINFWRR